MSRPTELAIAIAALSASERPGAWVVADEIRARLVALGFPAQTSAQQVASWLKPMCTCECPWFERDDDFTGMWTYRLTMFGLNDIDNKLRHVRVYR